MSGLEVLFLVFVGVASVVIGGFLAVIFMDYMASKGYNTAGTGITIGVGILLLFTGATFF